MRGEMKNVTNFLLVGFVSIFSFAPIFAQDAAAPMRRSSPSAENTIAPSTPTPTPIPEPIPSPEAISTPSPVPSENPPPVAIEKLQDGGDQLGETTPVVAEVGAEREQPAGAGQSSKPVPARSAQPREQVLAPARKSPFSFFRREPVARPDTPGGTQPAFDLSRQSSRTIAAIIQSLEKEWEAAISTHNVDVIDKLLADDFQGTSSTGRSGGKATLLAAVRNDKNVYSFARVGNMKVQSLGPDVAVVTGTATERGTTAEGQRFSVSRRFTDRWEQRNGRWQCVASSATLLR